MIDKERRKKLALHLRHLSVGLISNDAFEEAVMEDVSDGWLPEQYYRSKLARVKMMTPLSNPCLNCVGDFTTTQEIISW